MKKESMEEKYIPPEKLERKILTSLKSKGEIKEMAKTNFAKTISLSFAVILLIAASFIIGKRSAIVPNAESKNLYAMFLYNNNVSGEDEEQKINEYHEWLVNLKAQGKTAKGDKLEDNGMFVNKTEDQIAINNVEFNNSEFISGYFIIEAADYDEMLAIAKECPHVKYGGKVQIRKIFDLSAVLKN